MELRKVCLVSGVSRVVILGLEDLYKFFVYLKAGNASQLVFI